MDRPRTYPCGKLRPPAGPSRRQFVKGVLVGGASDLAKLVQSGEVKGP